MPGWTWDAVDSQVSMWVQRGELDVEVAATVTDILVLLSRRLNAPDHLLLIDERVVVDWRDADGASIRLFIGGIDRV